MKRVDSSAIEAIGYDASQRELYVRFHDTGTYIYTGVSPETYDEFLHADSKGAYLNREVKPNYAYREE